MRKFLLASATASALLSTAHSATIRIPDDYATIQQGVDAAASGDTVLVAPGTYTGPSGSGDCVVMNKGVSLLSEGGAALTRIDGEGTRRVLTSSTTGTRVIQGFTITGGSATLGAGLKFYQGNWTVTDCVIEGNAAAQTGGAIYGDWGSRATVQDNVIVNNSAPGTAGCYFDMGTVDFISNVVTDNNPGYGIGATVFYGTMNLADCVVINNGAGLGVSSQCEEPINISRCTFAGSWLAIDNGGSCYFTIDRTIIAGAIWQHVFWPWCEAGFEFDHCIQYGGGITPDPDLIVIWNQPNPGLDPLFCDLVGGDATVSASSPCLPANNSWGVQVGALGQGCLGPVSLEQESWGAIKARYRR
jgi:hypothetical protein